MFRFFTEKNWFICIFGSIFILISTWYQVEIDVKINEWFGVFYDDTLQKQNQILFLEEYFVSLFSFITLAALLLVIAVFISFFTAHYLFRWRTSMVEYYHEQ